MATRYAVMRRGEMVAGPFDSRSDAWTWTSGACMDNLLPPNAADVPKDWPGITIEPIEDTDT